MRISFEFTITSAGVEGVLHLNIPDMVNSSTKSSPSR